MDKKLKITVCVTTFNEKKEAIEKLLDALNNQTLKPDEIIIVDADKNSKLKKFQNSKQFKNLKIINIQNISRAEGRNIAIKKARNEIIATTDVGCVPRRDWLEKLVRPFEIASSKIPRNDTVVGGFYEMTYKQSLANFVGKNNLQKAMRVYLGVLPKNFDNNFMPSARSMAFTKTIWKKAGGFPENLDNTAEDTLFNVNLIKAGATFTPVKNAVVEWGTPKSIYDFGFKIYEYATGDAESGIWFHPVKRLQSHNIKILSIYLRYIVCFLLLVISKPLFFLFAIAYCLFAIRKAGIYGPFLQIVSDFAVMAGFARGILKRCVKI